MPSKSPAKISDLTVCIHCIHQGPCQGNQLTLAHSRLWDAVGGFLFIFAHMQDKLSRDPEQLELLRQFMNLQKEMMIMLLSMLEGN